MEEKNLQLGVKGDELPAYIKSSTGFILKLKSFKRLFKGQKEIDLTTELQYSIKQGKLTLRPFERVVIGTGLILSIPEGYKLDITSMPALVTSQGITVLSPPIDTNFQGEVDIILYNGSQFLSDLKIDMAVAKGTLIKCTKVDFISD